MLIRDLHENTNIDDMAIRAWRRNVMMGRMSHIPKLFKFCNFYTYHRQRVIETVLVVKDHEIAVDFYVYPDHIDVRRDPINASKEFTGAYVASVINSALGIDIRDVSPQGTVLPLSVVYDSDQLRTYIVSQVRPWAYFITNSNNNQTQRLEWLKLKAGTEVSVEQLLSFDLGIDNENQ